MTYALRAEGLVKRYGSTTALDGVDLTVAPGRVLGLLGPNGAGKTTAVRILATLIRPDSGTAEIYGHDLLRAPDRVRAEIALTGQYAAVDEALTGAENLRVIARLLELPRAQARGRADELLERFGLADAARRSVRTYSGGMRRRLDLAASLVGRPRLLFLDEPTTGLDPRARGEVWSMLRALVADGTAILLTTQYLDEADQLADEISVIDHGRVLAHGSPAALKARVGGQTLQVRVSQPGDVDAVAVAVTDVVGHPATVAADVVSAPVVHAPTAALAALAHRLDAERIEVAEVGLRLASLDEVFLSLTEVPA